MKNRPAARSITTVAVSIAAVLASATGCSTPSDATTAPVLVATSINHGYRVEAVAWMQEGNLCAAWDSVAAAAKPPTPVQVKNDDRGYRGCGFEDGSAVGASYVDKANGSVDVPDDVMPIYFGPLPPHAVAVRVGLRTIPARTATKQMFAGILRKYWTYSPATPAQDLVFPDQNPVVPVDRDGTPVKYAKSYDPTF
ncbi:hypothetical protein [Allobranchiibius huperziae]|uniref:Uncharacterized protein n=1 Tax=Allobranchiibius huperziae TaxID=1874116 RepID=A0A853DIT7_9MICO|nr:hypothetical protein [Allobranchiibius huperziae]NYJ75879.1 hypothetical protein [Allobranchiibius huperziae]